MKEVRGYTASTFAKSTQASYRTHLRTYLRFCLHFKLEPIPAETATLLMYIAFLARTLKPSSLGNYLNIVRLIHLDSGLENPLKENFAIQNLKKGISREKGSPPKQMSPITPMMMFDIYDRLSMLSARDIAFWAGCCVAYFGFLRKATLLPESALTPRDACLLRKDIGELNRDDFVLNVRRTKTIQCSKRILKLPDVGCPGSP